jgi:hypothetical protein
MSRIAVALVWLAACTAESDPTSTPTHTPDAGDRPMSAAANPPGLPERAGAEAAEPAEAAVDTAAPIDLAPRCAILSPPEGALTRAGVALTFDGEGEAADGASTTLLWTAPTAGMSVLGDAFDYILPPGRHTVTLQAWDGDGRTCAASVEVVVR